MEEEEYEVRMEGGREREGGREGGRGGEGKDGGCVYSQLLSLMAPTLPLPNIQTFLPPKDNEFSPEKTKQN